MNGYQPKKTCNDCLHLYTCKRANREKEACRDFKSCLPPPPPNTGSAVQKPKGKKQIVVIKINAFVTREYSAQILARFIEQSKTGIVVADAHTEIYNLMVDEDYPSDIVVKFKEKVGE